MIYSILCLIWAISYVVAGPMEFTKDELLEYKERTRELFDFGFNSYMEYGFPYDEVSPLSCEPVKRNFNDIQDIGNNDVLGNFTLSLIDSLTSFAVMGDVDNFHKYLSLTKDTLDLDTDVVVSVFETTIRLMGSFLSCHLYVTDPRKPTYQEDYDGWLLEAATKLGDKLLAAYMPNSRLPLPRINLIHGEKGIPGNLITENNAAGAASPMFEFTMLSYLTRDKKYELITRSAFNEIWNMRSSVNLVGMSFDPYNGDWFSFQTGVGASIDSVYEYALKGAIMFNDDELMDIWKQSYAALLAHTDYTWAFSQCQTFQGQRAEGWIDSLGAFFQGLQVLGGQVEDAKQKHLMYMKLWAEFHGLPERFMWEHAKIPQDKRAIMEWYPLRPEFVESNYFLYRATKDPFYLNVGVRILEDYETLFMQKCGFAGWQDIRTKKLSDKQESFVLSETFKYLYLLFDEENPINSDDRVIFSTEAHPLWLTHKQIKEYKNNGFLNETEVKDWLKPKKLTKKQKLRAKNVPHFEQETSAFHLDVCEVPSKSSFFSEMMSYHNLYSIDKLFNFMVKDPIELDYEFYDRWTHPQAKCSRIQTSEQMQGVIGNELHVARVNMTDIDGDIYLDSPDGMKVTVEMLVPGKVDSTNNIVNASMWTHTGEPDAPYAFRVLSINGLKIKNNKTFYLPQETVSQFSEPDSEGYLKFDGMPTINFRWY